MDIERLRAQLAHARRRLEEVERQQLDAAKSSGSFMGGTRLDRSMERLQQQVADGTGLEERRAEVERLETQLRELGG